MAIRLECCLAQHVMEVQNSTFLIRLQNYIIHVAFKGSAYIFVFLQVQEGIKSWGGGVIT